VAGTAAASVAGISKEHDAARAPRPAKRRRRIK
jgi:hypothetical protein